MKHVNAGAPGGGLGFPPGKSGGLIEACHRGRGEPAYGKFPPGKSGGLIEASSPMNSAVVTGCRFRRVNPAASLKRGDGRALADRADKRFRRVNPAASLKHPHHVQVDQARIEFPPGKSGGLIEARRRRWRTGPRRNVSAG